MHDKAAVAGKRAGDGLVEETSERHGEKVRMHGAKVADRDRKDEEKVDKFAETTFDQFRVEVQEIPEQKAREAYNFPIGEIDEEES